LAPYLVSEPHDAVLLTFSKALEAQVRQRLRVPVRLLPPSLFRYPVAAPLTKPRLGCCMTLARSRMISDVVSW